MPARFTLVTFLDNDGDEFPVRVEGHFRSYQLQECVVAARKAARREIDSGDFTPNGSLRLGKIELLGGTAALREP